MLTGQSRRISASMMATRGWVMRRPADFRRAQAKSRGLTVLLRSPSSPSGWFEGVEAIIYGHCNAAGIVCASTMFIFRGFYHRGRGVALWIRTGPRGIGEDFGAIRSVISFCTSCANIDDVVYRLSRFGDDSLQKGWRSLARRAKSRLQHPGRRFNVCTGRAAMLTLQLHRDARP